MPGCERERDEGKKERRCRGFARDDNRGCSGEEVIFGGQTREGKRKRGRRKTKIKRKEKRKSGWELPTWQVPTGDF